ncbi:MAG: hypothetical protein GX564_11965 [Oligosphaeraceae bacterium]|nr:hypothetical protein [Oligosphaeraceae bacterium]
MPKNTSLKMLPRALFVVLFLQGLLLPGEDTPRRGGENLLTNPGFEELTDQGHPAGWSLSGEPGPRSLDPTVSHNGRHSLKISPTAYAHSGCLQRFGDIESLQHDYILRGWVKYSQLSQEVTGLQQDAMPFVGIWTSVAGGGNSVRFNAFDFPPGDSDWRYFEKIFRLKDIRARIDSLAPAKRPQSWSFAIRIRCQPGTLWFDDLEFCPLVQPDRLEATLSSRAYSTGDAQVLATVQAIRATGTTAPSETEIQVQAALWDSRRDAVLSTQTLAVAAEPVKISFPLRGMGEGMYRLRLEEASGRLQPCELTFSIVNDPFQD